ncbi:hypothetical protein OB955_04865 [Halobacteria archaeon AArc-m2/3/4]|uniref:Uncharacterized protein n=1 Tax=Natronoglomus mannanivorans TaxID=2979990 RepID=A0ABT2QAW4_9EURY|nr:hypothetical protein [Halobacteria archaeon AArc-m2/3/4]
MGITNEILFYNQGFSYDPPLYRKDDYNSYLEFEATNWWRISQTAFTFGLVIMFSSIFELVPRIEDINESWGIGLVSVPFLIVVSTIVLLSARNKYLIRKELQRNL